MVISKDDDNHLVWWLTNSILVYRDGPWILKERNKRTVKLGRWTLRSSYVFFPLWNTFLKLITFWCLYLEKESRPYVTGLPRFRRRLRDNPLVFLFTFLPRLSSRRKYLSAADGGVSVAHRRAASFFFHYFTVYYYVSVMFMQVNPISRLSVVWFFISFSFFFLFYWRATWAFRHCWAEHDRKKCHPALPRLLDYFLLLNLIKFNKPPHKSPPRGEEPPIVVNVPPYSSLPR